MVLDALEMARVSRGGRRLVGLVAHSDAVEPEQYTPVRFTERLDEIGARPSIGTVADSFDTALAETTNGLYKAECVCGPTAVMRAWQAAYRKLVPDDYFDGLTIDDRADALGVEVPEVRYHRSLIG